MEQKRPRLQRICSGSDAGRQRAPKEPVSPPVSTQREKMDSRDGPSHRRPSSQPVAELSFLQKQFSDPTMQPTHFFVSGLHRSPSSHALPASAAACPSRQGHAATPYDAKGQSRSPRHGFGGFVGSGVGLSVGCGVGGDAVGEEVGGGVGGNARWTQENPSARSGEHSHMQSFKQSVKFSIVVP